MNKYLAVIGLYQGTKWIDKIIKSLKNQTIPPDKIVIWNNNPYYTEQNSHSYDVINCSANIKDYEKPNLGVYARFSAGLLYNYDRVLVLDDDTIPGSKWIENCYNTISQVGDESIIGYRGIRLTPNALYDTIAFEKGTESITEVDLIGHSFFVKRKHIISLFEDSPVNNFNGEDTHLSAVNWLKYRTRTYVPKQLLSEKETWGSSMQQLGMSPGRLSTSLGHIEHFSQREKVNEYWIYERNWKPMYLRTDKFK